MQAKYSDTTQTISLHLYQSFHRNVCTTDKIGFENASALCTQQKYIKLSMINIMIKHESKDQF